MDAALATLIAPKVTEIEDAWGKPLEDLEKLCILAGYQLRLEQEIAEAKAKQQQINKGTP